ncbi:MAG TPA: aromatic amino acid hydroxylase [Polyangiaceae bacterium]
MPGLPNVPPHLRRFVVEQDYSQYTAMDQAVWRFVLLQNYARLVETAHPAYREGLTATGLSVERIPSIAEMNERLGQFGWGAVCVDGFIPPRAFQEFQARGLLPIAADMRTLAHLVYTPAPDIIHEAAGHAPILTDPTYAAYLRRIGEIGKRAFTIPAEDRVFQAVYSLSEVKEDPSKSPESIARVERELDAALAGVVEPSEAAWLSRLYWWTAEYGLVGTPKRYHLYGAGLLSSLWESHSCHARDVLKIPLDETCTKVSYDITRPQPQLFVAKNFEHLHETLERVAKTLACNIGGGVAIGRAVQSRELASLRFSSGAWAIGILTEAGPNPFEPAWLRLEGPVAFAWDGVILRDERATPRQPDQWLITGPLAGGIALHGASDNTLAGLYDAHTGRHHLLFASGAAVEGRLSRAIRDESGRVLLLHFHDVRLTLPGRAVFDLPEYHLLATGDFITAEAGSVDARYHSHTDYPHVRVPKPRNLPEREAALLHLYETGWANRAREAQTELHAILGREFPREWLLRWNLLEDALKRGDSPDLAATLRQELETLEDVHEKREPIATGLGYLAKRFPERQT